MSKVIVYATTDPDCPANARFTARTFVEGKAMPVTFYAATEPGARKRASEWWQAQLDAERRRQEAAAKRKQARSKGQTTEGGSP